MKKSIQVIIWAVIILAVGVVSYYLFFENSETSNVSETSNMNDDLEIINQECLDQGGQVVERDPATFPKEACPEGTEFLGEITDLRCLCVCCK